MHIGTAFACCDAVLNHQAGDDGSEAGSGELLLESLLACAGVTFNAVATATGATFRPVQVVVEDEGDCRNTLGLDKAVPLSITDIRLRFGENSDATNEQLPTLRYSRRIMQSFTSRRAASPIRSPACRPRPAGGRPSVR